MKILIGLLLLAAATGWATENQLEYFYGRGIPRSSVDFGHGSTQEGRKGSNWAAQWLHKVGKQYYLGVGGGQFRSGGNVSGTLVPQAESNVTSRMTSILVLGRADLSWNPKVLTYVIAGAGWARHALSITAVPNPVWPDSGTGEFRTIVDDSQETGTYAAGLGLDYALNDRLFIGAEARYQGSLQKSFETTSAGTSSTGRTSVASPLSFYTLGFKAGVRY